MITMEKKNVLELIHFLGILVLEYFFIQSVFFFLFLSPFGRVMIPTYIWTNAVIAAIVLLLLHIWSWRYYYNLKKYFLTIFFKNHTYIYFKQKGKLISFIIWDLNKNIIFMGLDFYMGTVKGVVNTKRIIRYNTVPQKTAIVSNVLWQQARLGSTYCLWLFTKK